MDIRVVKKAVKNLRIEPKDEEFGRETKIRPRVEGREKNDPSSWPVGERRNPFFGDEREDFSPREDRTRKIFGKIEFGILGKIFGAVGGNLRQVFLAWKNVQNSTSLKVGWATMVFFGFIMLSAYGADGSDSVATLGEENPTAVSGAGVSVSGLGPKVSMSSHENRLEDLEERNLELSRKVESLSDQTKYYPVSSGKDSSQDKEIQKQENLILDLEEQIKAISDQNEAIIDFSLALDYKSLIYKDKAGNLDMPNGKVKAEEAEIEKVSIKNKEGKEAAGESKISPLRKDDNLDGLDDESLSDGKSVIVKTEAVGEKSKIFLTPNAVEAVKTPLTVTEKQNGQYFKVEVAEKVSQEVGFSWWIIETE